MIVMHWRPSGGRGEYEYTNAPATVENKLVTLYIPELQATIATDVRFRKIDGKPRFRRDDPSNKAELNLAPLVAAICGLPSPIREDKGTTPEFRAKQWVLDTVSFQSEAEDSESVTLVPVALSVRRGGDINISERINELLALRDRFAEVEKLLVAIQSQKNSADLTTLGEIAYEAAPVGTADLPDTDRKVMSELMLSDPSMPTTLGSEGRRRMVAHMQRERNKKIVDHAKLAFERRYGYLFCESCGVHLPDAYGPLADGFIEAHHRLPLARVEDQIETKTEDLAMLCPTCHRMIHRLEDCSLVALREILSRTGRIVSLENLRRLK